MKVRNTIHDTNNFGVERYKLQMNLGGWIDDCVLQAVKIWKILRLIKTDYEVYMFVLFSSFLQNIS